MKESTVLYRPVDDAELALIRESGWAKFPPRLPGQPFFYPVENEVYAMKIARDWNVKASGAGHVLRFKVESSFIERYPVQQVGGRVHQERWIPASDLNDLNDHIVGTIEVVASFH